MHLNRKLRRGTCNLSTCRSLAASQNCSMELSVGMTSSPPPGARTAAEVDCRAETVRGGGRMPCMDTSTFMAAVFTYPVHALSQDVLQQLVAKSQLAEGKEQPGASLTSHMINMTDGKFKTTPSFPEARSTKSWETDDSYPSRGMLLCSPAGLHYETRHSCRLCICCDATAH